MSESQADYLTARQVAAELGVAKHVLDAALTAEGIEAERRVAAIRLFNKEQLPLIQRVLDARASRGRGPRRAPVVRRSEVTDARVA